MFGSVFAKMLWCEDPEFSNNVCKLVYEKYNVLGKKGKPEFAREWTILAAVVGVFEQQQEDGRMELISLGTGSKCLGKNQLNSSGNLVNDSHAEVIVRRGFLRYLYHQLQLAYGSKASIFKVEEQTGTCALKNGISFHLFVSHIPCGDASIFPKSGDEEIPVEKYFQRKRKLGAPHLDVLSKSCCRESIENESTSPDINNDMEMTKLTGRKNETEIIPPNSESLSGMMVQTTTDRNFVCHERKGCVSANDIESSTVQVQDIYRTGAKCVPDGIQDSHDVGTGYHSVGALRTKPGRGDPTISMSCSDKFMKWCILGCQGALISHFLQKPIYFSSFVIGKCAYNEEAMKRAVFLRARKVTGLPDGYSLKQPRILQADFEFEHSKRKVEEARSQERRDQKLVPSPSAIIWIDKPSFYDIFVNGLKQGVTKANRESPKSRVCISKAELFSEFKKVMSLVPNKNLLSTCDNQKTYKQFKNEARNYNTAKEQLYKVFNTWLRKPSHFEMFS